MTDKSDTERVMEYVSLQTHAINNNYETIKGLLDIVEKDNDNTKDIVRYMARMEKKIDRQFKRLERRLERLENQFEDHREKRKH